MSGGDGLNALFNSYLLLNGVSNSSMQQLNSAMTVCGCEQLEVAETHLVRLQACECQRSCDVSGVKDQHGDTWKPDSCTTCQCLVSYTYCHNCSCNDVVVNC